MKFTAVMAIFFQKHYGLPEVKNEKKSRRHSIIGLGFDLPKLGKRKRKAADDDSISIQSCDTSKYKKKSRKSILRVSSIANLLSPSKSIKRENEFQRTISFKVPPSPTTKHNVTPYKAPQPSPAKQRLSRTWSEMMNTVGHIPLQLSHRDIKRQEAIYELYQGESDLVEDLTIVKKTYRDSMEKLHLMTEWELSQIFGPVDKLIPIHEELASSLQNQRLPDGTTRDVGVLLVDWVQKLEEYVPFCANQVFGKAMLDEKKNDPAVDDFLQRCQDSPFSRKLDLWTLLDGARGKFMKYPLLLRAIHKYTCDTNEDKEYLKDAIKIVERIISAADHKTGEAKCRYFAGRISFLYEEECEALQNSTMLLCNGSLKNNKGSKLHIFLFNEVLVVTRLVNNNGHQGYQVYRQPIPVEDLIVEDLKDGEVKVGSFRSAFGSGQTAKNVFRVGFLDGSKGQSHTLIAVDEHDKRQWLQCLKSSLKMVKKPFKKLDEDHLGLRPDPIGQSSESETELQPFPEADLQSLSENESENLTSDGSPGEIFGKVMRRSLEKENVKVIRKNSLTSLSSIASSLRSSSSSLRSSSSSLKSSTSSLKSRKSSSSLRKTSRKSKSDLKSGNKK
ncbi:rho guanine nucleotide exchange factor 3-like isoform X2 [Ostrea edulis]|uniref:rho guanine nucleotide exchange factor 3-like isoform X2 n=1 Tax=Ostrea edulis TaxID=37623 RepID=UPI0024AFF540|nr:rho guanine nucleotide exchange factor 3-like isoform X2 [Ostrea edulis]